MPKVDYNRDPRVRQRRKLLYERYGGYMTVANAMKEFGVSRPTALEYLSGLPVYSFAGRRLYDISDVAVRIEGCRIQ